MLLPSNQRYLCFVFKGLLNPGDWQRTWNLQIKHGKSNRHKNGTLTSNWALGYAGVFWLLRGIVTIGATKGQLRMHLGLSMVV